MVAELIYVAIVLGLLALSAFITAVFVGWTLQRGYLAGRAVVRRFRPSSEPVSPQIIIRARLVEGPTFDWPDPADYLVPDFEVIDESYRWSGEEAERHLTVLRNLEVKEPPAVFSTADQAVAA